ncbi:MAG: helix-turn-helix transcriptional regulator [Bacteroides sp.]|nr:helix-turn-helix transcriptional regulator [Bacteroides sp.]
MEEPNQSVKFVDYNEKMMIRRFSVYKGIPLGLIIKKDLKRNSISQKVLADKVGISYSSMNRALNGKRVLSDEEASCIDAIMGYEESFTKQMQSYFLEKDNKKNISNETIIPPYIRACVFWDIDLGKLDWIKHRQFIINRVSQYGNYEERENVENFYSSLNLGTCIIC